MVRLGGKTCSSYLPHLFYPSHPPSGFNHPFQIYGTPLAPNTPINSLYCGTPHLKNALTRTHPSRSFCSGTIVQRYSTVAVVSYGVPNTGKLLLQ